MAHLVFTTQRIVGVRVMNGAVLRPKEAAPVVLAAGRIQQATPVLPFTPLP